MSDNLLNQRNWPGLSGGDTYAHALWAARTLTVYRGVLADHVGRAMVALFDVLSSPREGLDLITAATAYGDLFTALAEEVELSQGEVVGDAWQNHLLDRILLDENPFSRKVQLAGLVDVGSSLLEAVRHDLRQLRLLCDLDPALVCERFEARMDHHSQRPWPTWSYLRPLPDRGLGVASPARIEIKQLLLFSPKWDDLLPELASHYAANGTGVFGRFRALRWVRSDRSGSLLGVAHPDAVRLDDLIGYERERDLLLVNTEHFLAGYPANNVLLYGDRGTGKSSTIKALLNEYGDRGLRLIEVSKQHLSDLPDILDRLRGRHQRFIVYIDDLSFDDHETDYKSLKAVLEGGLESRPGNVLLYATSNRRHLVRERFGDRDETAPDEIHTRDTMEEKLSLSDRFGITLVFSAPDQERYLAICQSLAEKRGLDVDQAELRRRALQWSAGQKGLSGRTARQFVDHLTAELALSGRT